MNIVHKIKYRFSEPYRIRIGCGLSPIRTKRERKALIQFCRGQLKEDYMKLNPKAARVFKQTIQLYEDQIMNNDWSKFEAEGQDSHIDNFIKNHIDWYWS